MNWSYVLNGPSEHRHIQPTKNIKLNVKCQIPVLRVPFPRNETTTKCPDDARENAQTKASFGGRRHAVCGRFLPLRTLGESIGTQCFMVVGRNCRSSVRLCKVMSSSVKLKTVRSAYQNGSISGPWLVSPTELVILGLAVQSSVAVDAPQRHTLKRKPVAARVTVEQMPSSLTAQERASTAEFIDHVTHEFGKNGSKTFSNSYRRWSGYILDKTTAKG